MQIITRAEWGFPGWKGGPPGQRPLSEIVGLTVHNDGGVPVGYQTGPSVPRATNAYHQNTQGWSAIGYHYQIDQAGAIFEGRGMPYIGAHAPAFNRSHIGVQFHIGGAEGPSDKALAAFAELRAWVEQQVGKGRLPVNGHRDGFATDCPGEKLYARVKAGDWPPPSTPATPQEKPAMDVTGRIGDKWREMGGTRSALGQPTGEEVKTDTGAWRPFERGVMIWSPDTDARENRGAIRERYADYGFEGGLLGYPVTDELPAKNGGRFQQFQRGTIYWHPDAGAHAVYGRIRDKWADLGHETGRMGYPTGDEFAGPNGGRIQVFQGGPIYWTLTGDAHAVWGSMLEQYARDRYENGKWGYPLGDETNTGRGWAQQFQGGTMTVGAPIATTKTAFRRPATHGYTTFRGRPCCTCLAEWLPRYEQQLLKAGIIKQSIDIYQLRGGAPASGGTHTQGGAFDIVQRSPEAIRIARQMGAAAWAREGMSPPHQHGVLKGCDTNNPAYYQIQALNAGFDGLGTGGRGGRDTGPRTGVTFPIINWDDGIRRLG